MGYETSASEQTIGDLAFPSSYEGSTSVCTTQQHTCGFERNRTSINLSVNFGDDTNIVFTSWRFIRRNLPNGLTLHRKFPCAFLCGPYTCFLWHDQTISTIVKNYYDSEEY